MTIEEENQQLRDQLRTMTARSLGHAYTAQMAEGGEDIQFQELKFERQQHAETRAENERLRAALVDCAHAGCPTAAESITAIEATNTKEDGR